MESIRNIHPQIIIIAATMATILSRPFKFAMKFINKCILVRLKRVQVLEPVYLFWGFSAQTQDF